MSQHSEIIADIENAKAEHVAMTAEQYHAHPATGASMVEDFIASRRLFEARYVTHTMPPRAPTRPMQLGTLIHLRILQPKLFPDKVAEPYPEQAPDGKNWLRRKGSDHEKWWADEVAKREGKIDVTVDELRTIEAVTESVLSKRWAKTLLRSDGESEFPIFWTDAETGLRLKCMVDWFSKFSLDLKSTVDPSPLPYARTLVRLGYHRKLANYRAGLIAFTDDPDVHFIHIAAGTEAPFPAGAYEIVDNDRDGKSLGHRQWRRALREIAECYESGNWEEPYEREIVALQIPGWAFTEDAYQL